MPRIENESSAMLDGTVTEQIVASQPGNGTKIGSLDVGVKPGDHRAQEIEDLKATIAQLRSVIDALHLELKRATR
jgi:hypothetical protein